MKNDIRFVVEKDDYGYMIFDREIDNYVDLGDGIGINAIEVLTFLKEEKIILFNIVQ